MATVPIFVKVGIFRIYDWTYNLKLKDMSNKNKKVQARRAAYEARQEKEGKKVVNWIFAVLVLLALCFIVYSVIIVM